MNRFFYGKLAINNLKKNQGLYIPYFITAIGMIAMFYIMASITSDKGIKEMPGGGDVQLIMVLGTIVIGIFAAIFLFYTNSFLMKRRKKEFGLYNILGMEKRHISRIMFYETCIITLVSLVTGLLFGIVLNKFIVLILLRLSRLSVSFGFQLYPGSIALVWILFGGIFLAILVYNLGQIRLSNPIELLQSKNQGEKEPKSRWVMTIVGLAALAGAYYIAITTENPLSVILLFFLAVLLVMLGTYLLFTAGSVTVLKSMRKNKSYYYKTKHFISVSGMIYRMKQNAVGLANICILSTAVLVMISATVCLNAGAKSMVKTLYPADLEVDFTIMTDEEKKNMPGLIKEEIENQGQTVTEISDYQFLEVSGVIQEDGIVFSNYIESPEVDYSKVAILYVITAQQYTLLSGNAASLEAGEILVYAYYGSMDKQKLRLGDNTYRVQSYLTEDEIQGVLTNNYIMMRDSYLIVLPDENGLEEMVEQQKQVYGENASEYTYRVTINMTGNNEEKKACAQAVRDKVSQYGGRTVSRAESEGLLYAMYGGFLFLGLFLGVVFLMATVLIIYYKQISEGYEDKERFEIMQKVGMSEVEVQGSIKSQILKVFFLPLITAGIHVIVAFPMIRRLLMLFGMMNTTLFLLCTISTILIFGIIYAVVYSLTAKAYYKIVKS